MDANRTVRFANRVQLAQPMPRFRHYVVLALLLAPIVFVSGKLLLTRVELWSWTDMDGRDVHSQQGWPWVFCDGYIDDQTKSDATTVYHYSWLPLIGDLAALLAVIAVVGLLLVRHHLQYGRWLKFSLRTLMVLITFTGIGLGWFMHEHYQWQRELQALQQLQASNEGWDSSIGNVYCGPEWLRRLWPAEDLKMFRYLVDLHFWNPNLAADSISEYLQGLHVNLPVMRHVKVLSPDTLPIQQIDPSTFIWIEEFSNDYTRTCDDMLQGLEHWPRLRKIEITDYGNTPEVPELSDRGLAYLARCRALEALSLECNREKIKITDTGIAELAALTELRNLNLRGITMTDAGIAPLTALKKLKRLELGGGDSEITDATIDLIARMTSLESLSLKYVNITPAGLTRLASMTQLRSLHLVLSNRMSDAGLAQFSALTNLERLDLEGGLSDVGIASLTSLSWLRSMRISAFYITDLGVARLSALKDLRQLELNGPIGDTAIDSLAQLPLLEELKIYGCTKLTDRGALRLLDFPRLKRITLPWSGGNDSRISLVTERQLRKRFHFLPDGSVGF